MTNIYDLPQEITPLGADIIYIVIDPSGSPEDRYITVADLLDSIQVVTIIDVDSAEAFVVQKDGGGQKVFIVDTIAEHIEIKGLVFLDGGSTIDIVRDEDNMASDDENALTTQQAAKAYSDTKLADQTIGIADDNLLEVDGVVAENDIMQATTVGLKGLTYAELVALIDGAAGWKFESEVGQTLVDHNTTGATETIDWTTSNLHTCEVNDDCTFTFTAPTNPGHLTLIIEGDGTPRSLTWPATVKWVGAGEPTWGGDDGKKNIMSMVWDGTDYIASGAAHT